MENTFGLLENINDEQWDKMNKIPDEKKPFEIGILSIKESWGIIKISIAGYNFVNNIGVQINEQYRFGKYGIKITNFAKPIIEIKIFTEKQYTDIAKRFGFS